MKDIEMVMSYTSEDRKRMFEKRSKDPVAIKRAKKLMSWGVTEEDVAKRDIAKEVEKGNYIFAKYNYNTGKYEGGTFTKNDVERLWAAAGGREKWNNINLKKMGPIPVDDIKNFVSEQKKLFNF